MCFISIKLTFLLLKLRPEQKWNEKKKTNCNMKQNCDTAVFKKRHLMRFYTRQNWNRPPTGVDAPGQWTQHTSTKAQSQFRGDTRAHVKLARWHFMVPTILAGCWGEGRHQNRAQVWWFYWGSTNTRRGVKKGQSLSIFFSGQRRT